MKKLLSIALLSALTVSCSSTLKTSQINAPAPKNIIMIVGDGMGPAYTTGYRYYMDDPNTKIVEETVFDRHLVGMASTYPSDKPGAVTDSAAGATALSTGIKTYNGAIAVDNHKQPLETVLEWAKDNGKKTGIVVTSQVNHATPASYLAHNESRRNYNEIADSYIDDDIKVDIMLGGGWEYFIREDRNLVNEFKQSGFHYIDNYDSLADLPKDKPVLGLFGDQGLPWALDDKDSHRLSRLTKAATEHLANVQGYFMLIEASQVDWAGHGNDIASAMAEMDDLAKTLEYLETYVKTHPDTLVVLTADHSTGGLSLGAENKYQWHPEILHNLKVSPETIAKSLVDNGISKEKAQNLFNFTLTEKEVALLEQAKKQGQKKLAEYQALSKEEQEKQWQPSLYEFMHKGVNKIIDTRTTTGWTTRGHTGIDVQVFALGAGKELFSGHQDNTQIAKKIFKLLGKQ